jgi:hypothetical protein
VVYSVQILLPTYRSDELKLTADYWICQHMFRVFKMLNYESTDDDASANIQLRLGGQPLRERVHFIAPFRAIWIFSKPERFERGRELKRLKGSDYHKIYTTSHLHSKKIAQLGIESTPLWPAPTQQYRPRKEDYKYEIAYIGTGIPSRRNLFNVLSQKFKVNVCGAYWDQAKYVTGNFWPNDRLGDFYNTAPLSVYCTDHAFIERGIVSVRILDVIASSDCLPIVQYNPGLNEIFGSVKVPTYNTQQELEDKIQYYLCHEAEREQKQNQLRKVLGGHNYQEICSQIIQDALQRM